jgi:hypothetical protein
METKAMRRMNVAFSGSLSLSIIVLISTVSTGAAQAPAPPAHQHYVYCISGTDLPVVYFSEVFAATTTSDRVGPSPAPNRFYEIADPFKAFLEKKYGAESHSKTPAACRVTNPDPAGLQAAQKAKQGFEDMYKQQYKKQIVETGWKFTP